MAFTEKRLAGPTAPSATTETSVYASPTATTTLVRQIVVCNTNATTITTSLSIVPYGGTAGTTNRIFKDLSVPANETIILNVSQVLEAGDFLSVNSSSANVTFTVSGIQSAGGMVISGLADSAVTTTKLNNQSVTASKLAPNVLTSNNQTGAIILMEMM